MKVHVEFDERDIDRASRGEDVCAAIITFDPRTKQTVVVKGLVPPTTAGEFTRNVKAALDDCEATRLPYHPDDWNN